MVKKVLKIVVRCIGFLIASILIAYSLLLLNSRYILHEALPMIGGYGHAIVLSGSMEPAFSIDDLLIIQECESYEIDDIVTYVDSDGMVVTHRIIDIDGDNITTKGDNNNIADPAFDISRIKGKVIAIIPKFGYVLSILQNPMCIVLVIGITIFLSELSFRREHKKKNQSLDDIKAEIAALKKQTALTEQTDSTENETQNKQ